VLRLRVSAAVPVTICSLQEAEFAQREAGGVVGGSPGDGGPIIEAQWPSVQHRPKYDARVLLAGARVLLADRQAKSMGITTRKTHVWPHRPKVRSKLENRPKVRFSLQSWYGMVWCPSYPPSGPEALLRVVASCSVCPVSEQHGQTLKFALVRRWVCLHGCSVVH
jgi:hypothetical protein